MNIVIGCDSIGFDLKETILSELKKTSHHVTDISACRDEGNDYPDVAIPVAKMIKAKEYDRGILICGTGIGMAIAANKVKGVYAAVCHDIYSTERSILSNDVQIMCMGALVIGKATAIALLNKWLDLKFVESPSSRKINKIKNAEEVDPLNQSK
jgi:ribose 5-phosphate isomerase B